MLKSPTDFPLTSLICDAIKMKAGTMTLEQIRKNWTAGKYPNVRADHARWYVEG